jgi:hypothetical protein
LIQLFRHVALGDDNSHEVASMLVDRSIPFMFMTGVGEGHLPRDMRGQTRLTKPAMNGALIATLEAILLPKAACVAKGPR